MKNNKSIYEINTRVWIKRFSKQGERVTLKDVPEEYWKSLSNLGINYIWLMGIWKTNDSIIDEYCFEPELIEEYKRALSDFKKEDVIGSPYSIDRYELNPHLGTIEELLEVKKYLNSLGIKLILDFISNHFSAHSTILESNPEYFLPVNKSFYERDSHTYFKSKFHEDKYFAHGRDPFFPAWQDTVQVNYFNPSTRSFMIETLKNLTTICDGVRCDMAMLSLNNVFDNTWGAVLNSMNMEKPKDEFWKTCIGTVKDYRSDFIFIGEAYWDLEYELQKLGFDYTYDKKLLDRLKVGQISEIKSHLMADEDYQYKSVRFLENHDEPRSIVSLGKEKAKAAAVIISTINGLKFYNDGQFEGKKIKLPVQLGREPKEGFNDCIYNFYTRILKVINNEVFKYGTWKLVNPIPAWEDNRSYTNFLAWMITYTDRKRLVVINYSREVAQCRIKLQLDAYPKKFKLKDVLNNKTYYRNTEEVLVEGLYIELGPYKSHIFSF